MEDKYHLTRELIFLLQQYEMYANDLSLIVLGEYLSKLKDIGYFIQKTNINSNTGLFTEIDKAKDETESKIRQIKEDKFLLTFNKYAKNGRKHEHALNYVIYRMSLLFLAKDKIDWAKMYVTLNSHPTLHGFFKRHITSFHNEYHAKDTLRKKAKSWKTLTLKPKKTKRGKKL